jgi:glycosyltransferase 2 family protein
VSAGTQPAVSEHRSRYPRVRRLLSWAFFGVIAVVVFYAARGMDWSGVLHSLRGLDRGNLALALLLSAASYAGYACTDLFARPYLAGQVTPPRSMLVAFISYAFNQNLGSLVGSIGFRFRMYSRLGVAPTSIASVVGLSFVTNWSGYLLLAGASFLVHPPVLPAHWEIGTAGLRIAGAVLLLVLAAYLALCAFSTQRSVRLGRQTLHLPSARLALLQLLLSCFIWLCIASCLHVLIGPRLPFRALLTIFLLASVAGLISHIPAGLGVIEAVFLALSGPAIPRHEMLAALLAYRAVYYLAPLVCAALLYVFFERSRKARQG